MNVDAAIYLSGRHAAERPDSPFSVTEVEDLIRWTLDTLGAHFGERFTFERADGQPINEDWDEATAYHVTSLDDWDEIDLAGHDPEVYVLRRWVLVAERERTLPASAPTQTEALPL